MKKFTLIMLTAVMALTMTAQKFTEPQVKTRHNTTVVTPSMQTLKAITAKAVCTGKKADVPEGYAQVTLTAPDIWNDGSGYQMLLDADATAYGSIIPETGALTTDGDVPASTYAEFEYKIPENADGALATSNIVFDQSVTITIPAGVYDWCITNPTPGDRMWIAAANGNVGGRQDDYEFASGASYEFVISVYGSNDGVDVTIDDPTAPVIPVDLAVDPALIAGTYAEISWVPGANNEAWNLRYRPYVDPSLQNHLWDLPYPDGYEEQLEGWYIVDNDGDGANWGLDLNDEETNVVFTSASYDYNAGGALTPDNWLISPVVGLGGTLSFDAWNYSASFPEIFSIYVYVGEDEDFTIEDFVPVAENITVEGTTPLQYTYDLSAYEGMGRFAIRHYGTYDQWRFYVGNIALTNPDAVPIPEWTVEENINPAKDGEMTYKIEGLTPETEYEVQVQAIGPDGRITDWTKSVRFTTLAEDPEQGIEELYMVGTFNGWSQVDDMVEFTFADGQFTATVDLEAGAEFKLITPDDSNPTGWKWFGGVDENQVGYFLINTDLLGVGISLIDGANFMVEEANSYSITVTEARGLNEPLIMTVTEANPTAITDITAGSKDNTWFNIQGMKIQGVPTVPGIYINGGKKVVIK